MWQPRPGVNLWGETPGASFTDKFAVMLLDAHTHNHNGGQAWVTYNDAVNMAHHLRQSEHDQDSS